MAKKESGAEASCSIYKATCRQAEHFCLIQYTHYTVNDAALISIGGFVCQSGRAQSPTWTRSEQ